jgi:hypothetical protein
MTATPAPLVEAFAGLLATPTARLPYQSNVLLRSFVLQRSAGNVVVYNSPGVSECASAINDLGGATMLLVNHEHEAMYGAPDLDVQVFVHERDRAATNPRLPVAGVFGERRTIDGDLEVIPTPGHTSGTTSYLWEDGTHRFLFTGDFIWTEHGEWKAVLLDPGQRQAYLDSLAIVRDLDFDVLVPWGVTEGDPCAVATNRKDARARVGAIMKRLEAGGNR